MRISRLKTALVPLIALPVTVLLFIALLSFGVFGGGDRLGARALAQSGGACQARTEAIARPERVILGDSTRITMTVLASCETVDLPVHAVLAVDNNVSLGGSRMGYLRQAIEAFVGEIDFTSSRVGMLAYFSNVDMLVEPTSDPSEIVAATARFSPRLGTNMRLALLGAEDMLERAAAARDPDAGAFTEVVVVLAGSEHEGDPEEVLDVAQRLKDRGVLIVSVALFGDADFAFLEALATSPEHFYVEGTGLLYPELLREVAGNISSVHLRSAYVTDVLPADDLELVWGSDVPPARVRDGALLWRYDVWPSAGVTITFELEPLRLGRMATSVESAVELHFDRGAPEMVPFPIPQIEVVPAPTQTGTPTDTPPPTSTPAPTAVILPAYLPLAINTWCKPDLRGTDFVLAIDTSSSMLQRAGDRAPHLMGATLAASRFVDALDLGPDRAAVITFGGTARRIQDLTASRPALQNALASLFRYASVGSRIDLGLRLGFDTLVAGGTGAYPGPIPPEYASPDRPRSIILLSDGRAERGPALAAAADARADGVIIYTIGVGDDLDAELLRQLAGDPSRYYETRDGARLESIYLALALERGCR